MFNEMKDAIDQLDEKELKSLLFQFFFRMQAVENRKDYSEQQFFLDIKNTYNDLLEERENHAMGEQHTQFDTTHILFGDAPTGSLKLVLKELGINQKEKIVSFSDLFSIGPIWKLHESKGIFNRHEWLRAHINNEDDMLTNYQAKFKQTILEIEQIPSQQPIIIWAGENAHEQTGLRLVLYLLKEKTSDILIINPNEAYQTKLDTTEIDFTLRHMGELSFEQLKQIYENEKNAHALTQTERKTFVQQWEQLCQDKEVLRIWENNKIISVPETFYDEYIINTLKKFHKKDKQNEFIKSARIIGEVVGHLDQYVGDHFIEYRIKRLVADGIFDIEDVTKAMRYYSIKVR